MLGLQTELDGVILRRTRAGVYADQSGRIYRLVPVDRAYRGKKAPKYYLQRIERGKARYISGVFETADGAWSLDLKDGLGVKTYFDMRASCGGEILEIRRRQSKKRCESGERAAQ